METVYKDLKASFKRWSGRRALAVRGSTALSLLCCLPLSCSRLFSPVSAAKQAYHSYFRMTESIHQSAHTPVTKQNTLFSVKAWSYTTMVERYIFCLGYSCYSVTPPHLIVLADKMTVQAMSVGKVLLLPLCPILSMLPDKLRLCLLFSILLSLQQRKQAHLPAFLSMGKYLSAGNVLHEWKHAQVFVLPAFFTVSTSCFLSSTHVVTH